MLKPSPHASLTVNFIFGVINNVLGDWEVGCLTPHPLVQKLRSPAEKTAMSIMKSVSDPLKRLNFDLSQKPLIINITLIKEEMQCVLY